MRSPSEGAAEGGCGGNSASPEPKRSPAALLVQSRVPQKSFLFLLEEEIGRAQIRKARNIFLWCPPRLCEAVAGCPHSWGFSATWVLTFSNKHHHFRFAEEVVSGLRPSALVSAKKFQGVLNSAKRIPAESRRFPNEVWIALSAQEPMRRDF